MGDEDRQTPGTFPHQLETWWENGEGAAKIRWGQKGDFMRCVRLAVDKAHMTPEQAKGFCNKRHQAVLGVAPGKEHKKEYEMIDTERRYTPTVVEIRVARDRNRIGGYAATFDRLSKNLGGFVEVCERSMLNKSRADGWPGVIARYNHDDNMLLGTTGAGTLDLRLDETGLYYEVDPPQSRLDILELVERGDVRFSSFAFRVPKGGDEWTMTDQGYPLRRLHEVQLVDVSPVVNPAYIDTSVGLRSLASHLEVDLNEIEEAVREDEIRKFFVRTDDKGPAVVRKPKRTLYGSKAVIDLLGRRDDPSS